MCRILLLVGGLLLVRILGRFLADGDSLLVADGLLVRIQRLELEHTTGVLGGIPLQFVEVFLGNDEIALGRVAPVSVVGMFIFVHLAQVESARIFFGVTGFFHIGDLDEGRSLARICANEQRFVQCSIYLVMVDIGGLIFAFRVDGFCDGLIGFVALTRGVATLVLISRRIAA